MPRKFKKYLIRFLHDGEWLDDDTQSMWTHDEHMFVAVDDEHARQAMERFRTDSRYQRGYQGQNIRRVRLYALTNITKQTKKEA